MQRHGLVNATLVSWWLSLLAAVPLSCTPMEDAAVPRRSEPEVIVEAPEGGALVDGGLWLRVVLDNGVSGCRAVVVSQRYAGFTDGDGPTTLLDFDIVDEKGDRVLRSGNRSGTRTPYVSGDVMFLDCGALHGWYVVVGKPEWEYSLRPGKYRLRARIENRVRAHFDRHPAQMKSLARAMGLDKDDLAPAIRDFSIVSQEVVIEVSAK